MYICYDDVNHLHKWQCVGRVVRKVGRVLDHVFAAVLHRGSIFQPATSHHQDHHLNFINKTGVWLSIVLGWYHDNNCVNTNIIIISSVRSSSGYHGLIEIRSAAPTFSNFSNSSDSKVKVKVKGPNMCYIFEKHGIQGYWIWHSRVSNVKYTNTRLHKYANTQIQSA